MAPKEQLQKDQLMQIAEECAKEFGFENNQYIAILHKDTKHQHLHIVANRTGFDRRTVSDSNNFKKMANFCRKMESDYQLKQVLNPKRFLSKEQRLIQRTDARKEQLKQHIKQALINTKSYREFEQRMKEKGYKVIKGRGISFIDDKKVKVKGSELNFSLQTIERILEKQRMLAQQKEQSLLQKAILFNHLKNSHAGKPLNYERDFSTVEEIKPDVSKTIELLMKPEENHEQLRPELLAKKKEKKKGRHRHL